MSALSEQPPPGRRAKAGYYPDPLGSRYSRFWDGVNWTPTLGPQVDQAAPRGKAIPPPTKVCRYCSAQSETFEGNCPNCGRSYSGMSTGAVVGIVAAAAVVCVLFLGGCAALIVAGINEVEEEQDEHAISRAQFESIQLGSTRASVEARLGEPFETDEFGRRAGEPICMYYPEKGDDLFDDKFEFCFFAGRLDSKHAP